MAATDIFRLYITSDKVYSISGGGQNHPVDCCHYFFFFFGTWVYTFITYNIGNY